MREIKERIGKAGGMKSRKINNWDATLAQGNWSEQFIQTYFYELSTPIIERYLSSKRYEFNSNNKLHKIIQFDGIDGKVSLNLCWEAKVRAIEYSKEKDILLEIMSKIENNTLGWFFYSKADFIFYLFADFKKKEFVNGYLLDLGIIQRYFTEEKLKDYPVKIAKTEANGEIWHTENRAVPIRAFPKNSVIKIINILNEINHQIQKVKKQGQFNERLGYNTFELTPDYLER